MPRLNSSTTLAPSEAQQFTERISELEEQVSNLKRLEVTLERNAALFTSLVAASREGIAMTRADGTIIRVVKPILGYESNVSGMSVLDLVHPDDRSGLEKAHQDIATGRAKQIEIGIRLIRADGCVVYVEDTIRDMLDDAAVQAIVHNYRDVTARREGEMTAGELMAVLAGARFAFFSKNLTGIVQTWNAGAEAMFGYTSDEMIGQHIWKMVPIENRSQEEAFRKVVIDGGKALAPFRTKRIRKDGQILAIDLVLAPIVRGEQVRGIAHLSYPVAN